MEKRVPGYSQLSRQFASSALSQMGDSGQREREYLGTYARSLAGQGETRAIEKDAWYEALGPGRTVVADAGLKAQDFAPRFPTPDRLQAQLQLGMAQGSMTLLEMELDPDGSELAVDAIDRGGIYGESIVIGTFGVS